MSDENEIHACETCGAEPSFPVGKKPPRPYPCLNPECASPDIYWLYEDLRKEGK